MTQDKRKITSDYAVTKSAFSFNKSLEFMGTANFRFKKTGSSQRLIEI
jgi:hypothetical protein